MVTASLGDHHQSMGDDEPGERGARPRCVLVDDHPEVLNSLEALLDGDGIDIVGKATTGAEGLRELERRCPDLAIVDLRLPDISGYDIAREAVRISPGTAILIHTADIGPGVAERGLEAGARAVVLKSVPPSQLLLAVAAVLAGEVYVDPGFHGGAGASVIREPVSH